MRILFIALHAYILRHLIKLELAEAQDPTVIRKSFVGRMSYLVGAASAWFSVHAAFLIYLLTPLFSIVPPPAGRITGPGARASASLVEPT